MKRYGCTQEKALEILVDYIMGYASAAESELGMEVDKRRDNLEKVLPLFKRGYIYSICISNEYEQAPGETFIDLANLGCGSMFISNCHYDDDTAKTTSSSL